MKRLVALVILAGLSGCLTQNVASAEISYTAGGYLVLESGLAVIRNETEPVQLDLYTPQYQNTWEIGPEPVEYTLSKGDVLIANAPFVVAGIALEKLGLDFAEILVAAQENRLAPLTDALLNLPLEPLPFANSTVIDLPMHLINLNATIYGVYQDLELKIQGPNGLLFAGNAGGSTFGPATVEKLQGVWNRTALGGPYTLTITASHLDGFIILSTRGYLPQPEPLGETQEAGNGNLAFQFGLVHEQPVSVKLHPKNQQMVLQSSGPAEALLVNETGVRSHYKWAGNITIATHGSKYAIAPLEGTFLVGVDKTPADFQMKVLETTTLRFMTAQTTGPRFVEVHANGTLDGVPFRVTGEREPAGDFNCYDASYVRLSEPGKSVSLMHGATTGFQASSFLGLGELQLTIGTARNPCYSYTIAVESFDW